MKNEADIRRCCDLCFRGMDISEYRATGRMRKVLGTNEETPELICVSCHDQIRDDLFNDSRESIV